MLTRLEVDGFKNLRGAVIEFGPFTCIAGENGAGKSNVFDAIEFLSLLASHSLMEAAQRIRSTRDDRSGDPRDLFWRGSARSAAATEKVSEPVGNGRLMRLAAEMIVPDQVEDDFGRQAEASITFVRYEVDIGHEPATGLQKIGRLVLVRESLQPIRLGDAHRRLGFRHSAKRFRRNALKGRRSGGPFISTQQDEGDQVIVVHQDGGSRGKPKPASAARAPATVVSTITGADDPTILAARREMQSWRQLALEPSALRASDRYHDPRVMAIDGQHLPAALFRIATRQPASGAAPDPDGTYARVTNRLSALTGVGVRRVLVDTDDMRELITLKLEEPNGVELPARSLSEGTLRFLALAVLSEDPDARGIICMEEPENGMHPANLEAMVDLLRDLAFDPFDETGDDNPFRQVIANTHSPSLVQLLKPEELLFASADFAPRGDGEIARALRLAPLKGTWRDERLEVPPVTKTDILPYLTSPVDTQLSLDSVPA
ncbi:MAG: AAA family ATPase [bacterium]|nr:AAA family ATPase [bacterium]MCY3926179.1 AAA family ATPase [bacterium]